MPPEDGSSSRVSAAFARGARVATEDDVAIIDRERGTTQGPARVVEGDVVEQLSPDNVADHASSPASLDPPHTADATEGLPSGRRHVSWRHALGVGVVCFA